MNILHIKIKIQASAFKQKKTFYLRFICSFFKSPLEHRLVLSKIQHSEQKAEEGVHFEAEYIQMSFPSKTNKN